MPLPFVKTEAAGNDLILVDLRETKGLDVPEMARRMCDRHFGIGGDGLLVIEDHPNFVPFVRMFNPDGTEDFCGNGMRCVAASLHKSGQAADDTVTMRTPRGVHKAEIEAAEPGCYRVTVELLPPEFEPSLIPVAIEGNRVLDHALQVRGQVRRISCVAIGTVHTAIFSQSDVPEDVFQSVSPVIENHAFFPERTSVLWCHVVRDDLIHMRIWERAVGETLACGTGTCAAVVLGRELGLTGDRAEVVTRGGRMSAVWHGTGPVKLTGPARIVYGGEWTREVALTSIHSPKTVAWKSGL